MSQRLDHSGYEQLVRLLQRAVRLAPEALWRPVVAALRATHAKKPLTAFLDAANLGVQP